MTTLDRHGSIAVPLVRSYSAAVNWEWAAVGTLNLVYCVYVLCSGWLKATNFAFGKQDAAIWLTGFWQVGNFQDPVTYVIPGYASNPFLGLHFMPAGFVYAWLYRLAPSLNTIVLLYAVSFAVAGLFLYLTAKVLTRSWLVALGLELLYLVLLTPALDHFYLEDWAVPFVATGIWLTVSKRFGWATVAWLAAMMFKEYIGLAIGAFGLAWAVSAWWQGRRDAGRARAMPSQSEQIKFGLLWLGLGVFWFVIGFFGIMPWAEPGWVNQDMFRELGGSPLGVLGHLASNPMMLLDRMVTPEGIRYLAALVVPLALLPLIGFEFTLALVPVVLLNFMADGNHALGLNEHYTTMVEPFLIAGTALGIARLQGWLHGSPRGVRIAVAGVVVGVLVLSGTMAVRYHAFKLRQAATIAWLYGEHTRDITTVLAMIPSDATVAAEEQLMPILARQPQLAHRDNVRLTHPDMIVRDRFFDSAFEAELDRALGQRLALLGLPTQSFYNPADWLSIKGCDAAGYETVMQQGSVTLCRKEGRQQTTDER